jgi:rRNA-processing protein FCF1
MEVLLDTNFIISCVRKRIDFLEELGGMGFKPKVPREVLQEMKDLKREGKTGRAERDAIDLAFDMLENAKVKKVKVGGRTVDLGLIAKGQAGIYIATLDNGIKREIPNRVVIESAKNRLMVERD